MFSYYVEEGKLHSWANEPNPTESVMKGFNLARLKDIQHEFCKKCLHCTIITELDKYYLKFKTYFLSKRINLLDGGGQREVWN